MKALPIFMAGIVIGGAIVWYIESRRSPTPKAGELQSPIAAAGHALQDKLRSLNLSTEEIKDEMAREGRVIRQKMQEAGQTVADATSDARTTAAIKGKLIADPDLSALNVSVNTTQGVVTLSGTVSSEEKIGKAMLLALQTDGVHEVISTLQVKPM